MRDQEEGFAAVVDRLEAAVPALARALGAPPEREAELLNLLQRAADSYWRRRRLPPIPSGLQPSVTKRRFAGLGRSIRRSAAATRELPRHDRALFENRVGSDQLAQWLELSEAMAAGLDDAEIDVEFAVPERFDAHLALLVDHLVQVFAMVTGARPTLTWSDSEEGFTSPVYYFAHGAVAAIDPQAAQHGSIDEAVKRSCAKRRP